MPDTSKPFQTKSCILLLSSRCARPTEHLLTPANGNNPSYLLAAHALLFIEPIPNVGYPNGLLVSLHSLTPLDPCYTFCNLYAVAGLHHCTDALTDLPAWCHR